MRIPASQGIEHAQIEPDKHQLPPRHQGERQPQPTQERQHGAILGQYFCGPLPNALGARQQCQRQQNAPARPSVLEVICDQTGELGPVRVQPPPYGLGLGQRPPLTIGQQQRYLGALG